MENDKNINFEKKESSIDEVKNQATINGVQSDINLTNEQKLNHISELIQAVDKKFEASELNKKLIKLQMKK